MLNGSICDAVQIYCKSITRLDPNRAKCSPHGVPVPSEKTDTIRLPARIQNLQLHSCVRLLKTHTSFYTRKTLKVHPGLRLVTHIFVALGPSYGSMFYLRFRLFKANPGAIYWMTGPSCQHLVLQLHNLAKLGVAILPDFLLGHGF